MRRNRLFFAFLLLFVCGFFNPVHAAPEIQIPEEFSKYFEGITFPPTAKNSDPVSPIFEFHNLPFRVRVQGIENSTSIQIVTTFGKEPLQSFLVPGKLKGLVKWEKNQDNSNLNSKPISHRSPGVMEFKSFQEYNNTITMTTESGKYAFSGLGHLYDLSSLMEGELVKFDAFELLEAGEYFLIVHMISAMDKPNGTFLVRHKDQMSLKIDQFFHPTLQNFVDDGILQISSSPRKIDLDRFEDEASFKAVGDNLVIEEEKKLPAVDTALHYFEEVKREEITKLPLNAEEKKLVQRIQMHLTNDANTATLILGDAQTGKKTLAEQAIRFLPRTWTVLRMDRSSISSSTKHVGELEKKVNALIEASKVTPIVLLVDDLHTLAGTGKYEGNNIDIFKLMNKAIKKGYLRVLATDLSSEYYRFVTDESFRDLFTSFDLQSASPEETLQKMKNWLKYVKKYADIPDETLIKIRDFAAVFDPARNEPGRSIRFLDTLLSQLQFEQRSLNSSKKNRFPIPTEQEIESIGQELYKVDPAMTDYSLLHDRLKNLSHVLKTNLIGHSYALENILSRLNSAHYGLSNHRGPRAIIHIDGPPGSGKTETALLTAKGLKVDNFHRIMLSRFDDTPGNQVTDLINEIALQARKNRYSVILLDELDKIPRNFQNALLEMFDSDFIVLREGTDSKVAQRPTRVYTKDMTFFIGSNYLSEWLLEKLGKNKNLTETDITLEEMNKVMLERGASAPLMDRLGISRYVYFPPKPEELRQIYQLRLKEKLEAYKKNNRIKVRLENPQDFIEHVMKETESKKYSTRQGQDYLAMLVDKLVAERLSHLSRPPASLTVSVPTEKLSCDALFSKKKSGEGFGFLKNL